MKLRKPSTLFLMVTFTVMGALLGTVLFSSIMLTTTVYAQQQSPEEIEEEILRGTLELEGIDTDTTTTTESSSDQLLSNDSVLVYESPAYGIRTQYPDGWEIVIQNTSNSSLSLRFNSPLENDTDIYRENVLFEVSTISNNTALSNYTTAALGSYLKTYRDLKFNEVSSTNLTSDAIPAYKLVGGRSQDGLDFMQIFAIKEDKVYTILYSSEKSRYSTYLPIIEEMINSFEVT